MQTPPSEDSMHYGFIHSRRNMGRDEFSISLYFHSLGAIKDEWEMLCDPVLHKERHKIENIFGTLKDWRRIHF